MYLIVAEFIIGVKDISDNDWDKFIITGLYDKKKSIGKKRLMEAMDMNC